MSLMPELLSAPSPRIGNVLLRRDGDAWRVLDLSATGTGLPSGMRMMYWISYSH